MLGWIDIWLCHNETLMSKVSTKLKSVVFVYFFLMIFLNVYPIHTQAKSRFEAVCQTWFEIFFFTLVA